MQIALRLLAGALVMAGVVRASAQDGDQGGGGGPDGGGGGSPGPSSKPGLGAPGQGGPSQSNSEGVSSSVIVSKSSSTTTTTTTTTTSKKPRPSTTKEEVDPNEGQSSAPPLPSSQPAKASVTSTQPTQLPTDPNSGNTTNNNPSVPLLPAATSSSDPDTAGPARVAAATSHSAKTPAIIGGVLGPVVLLLLLGALVLLYKRRKRARDRRAWERTHADIADAVRVQQASRAGVRSPTFSATNASGGSGWSGVELVSRPGAVAVAGHPAEDPFGDYQYRDSPGPASAGFAGIGVAGARNQNHYRDDSGSNEGYDPYTTTRPAY